MSGRGVILTDAKGCPFERPERADFASSEEYFRALWAFRDRVYAIGNEAFARGFARGMRDRGRP